MKSQKIQIHQSILGRKSIGLQSNSILGLVIIRGDIFMKRTILIFNYMWNRKNTYGLMSEQRDYINKNSRYFVALSHILALIISSLVLLGIEHYFNIDFIISLFIRLILYILLTLILLLLSSFVLSTRMPS